MRQSAGVGARPEGGEPGDMRAHLLHNLTVARNVLGRTNGFHVRLVLPDGAHCFLIQNQYRTGSTVQETPLLDPVCLPVHYFP